MTDNIVEAPWTDDEVRSLNDFQRSGAFHPFTCILCRDQYGTRFYRTETGDLLPLRDDFDTPEWVQANRDMVVILDRELVATNAGWVCETCDYTQNWAWKWMADGSWAIAFAWKRET